LVEDKAVDLYVLERAFASTHPESEPLFSAVLDAYAVEAHKSWPTIKRRLDDGMLLLLSLPYAQPKSPPFIQYDYVDGREACLDNTVYISGST